MAFRASRSEAALYGSDKQIDTTVKIKVSFANSGSFQTWGSFHRVLPLQSANASMQMSASGGASLP
jgi:hypothetical protein